MSLLSNYIEPLTQWLHANPHWAGFITFSISFAESLAIVGSIIPGTVTMTGIGILAGSGVIPIPLTFICATLGAIAGDSFSYFLGYYFSESLGNIWPFSRYPHWISYGKSYFEQHGGKSVLLGRFIGPIRSIIPLIAGMMHMPQLRFLFANVVSAIGWAILYLLPGVFIGTASTELSSEAATRFFLFILLSLVILWLGIVVLKWLIRKIIYFLDRNIESFWLWLTKHPHLQSTVAFIRSQQYPQSHAQILLFTLSFIFLILLIGLSINITFEELFNQLDLDIFFFMQTIRTSLFDKTLLVFAFLSRAEILASLFASVAVYLVAMREWRTFYHWLSLNVLTLISCIALHKITKIDGYPSTQITLIISQFCMLTFFMLSGKSAYAKLFATYFLSFLLSLIIIAHLYFGIASLSALLASTMLASILCFLHVISYRRKQAATVNTIHLLFIFLISTTLSLSYVVTKDYSQQLSLRKIKISKTTLTHKEWWHQKQPILPVIRTNRFGNPISLYNLQYLGALYEFEAYLEEKGWVKINDDTLEAINRIFSKSEYPKLPIVPQLYKNQRPSLVMVKNNSPKPMVIRFWRSYYFVNAKPIWIGSVHFIAKESKKEKFLTPDNLRLIDKLFVKQPFANKRLKIDNYPINKTSINAIVLLIDNR